MTKIESNNTDIIYRLVKKNPNIVLSSSDHRGVFADGGDKTEVEKTFGKDIVVTRDFVWSK